MKPKRISRRGAGGRRAGAGQASQRAGRARNDRAGRSGKRGTARRTRKADHPPGSAAPGRGVLLRIHPSDDAGCAAVCWGKAGTRAAALRGVGFGWPDATISDAAHAARVVRPRKTGTAAHARPSKLVAAGQLTTRWPANQMLHAAEWAAGLGHRIRLTILMGLAAGTASYQTLCRTTGLTAGPLQHHVRTLKQAGLLQTPERNAYAITALGRMCLGLLRAMSSLGHRR